MKNIFSVIIHHAGFKQFDFQPIRVAKTNIEKINTVVLVYKNWSRPAFILIFILNEQIKIICAIL